MEQERARQENYMSMGSLTIRKGKGGRLIYIAQIRIPGVKTVSKSFPSEDAAREYLATEVPKKRIEAAGRARPANAQDFFAERFSVSVALYLKAEKPPKKRM